MTLPFDSYPLFICPTASHLPSYLAQHPQLTINQITDTMPTHYFQWSDQLCWIDQTQGQVCANFLSPKMLWRAQHLNKAQEPLLRAINWKPQHPLKIVDLTAGLGIDSAVLAMSGNIVWMCERHPILQILLTAGLQQLNTAIPPHNFAENLHLCQQDGIFLCQDKLFLTQHAIDVLYLDPMYPHRKKSALVKQELRVIRTLVGDDPDADQLLNAALESGIKRIVVKRPCGAPWISEKKPHHAITSPNTRFDVYLN